MSNEKDITSTDNCPYKAELTGSADAYQPLCSLSNSDDHAYVSIVNKSHSNSQKNSIMPDEHDYIPISDHSKTETKRENTYAYNTPGGKLLQQHEACINAEKDYKPKECPYAANPENDDKTPNDDASKETCTKTIENGQHGIIITESDSPKVQNTTGNNEVYNLTETYKSVSIEMDKGDYEYTDCSSNAVTALTGQTKQSKIILDEHGYIPMTEQASKKSKDGTFSVGDHAYLILVGEPSHQTDEKTKDESDIDRGLPGISKPISTTETGSMEYAYAYRTTADALLVQNAKGKNVEDGGEDNSIALCATRRGSSAENDHISYDYITSDDEQSERSGQKAEKESEKSDHYDYIPIDKTPLGQAKKIEQAETDSANNKCTNNDCLSLEENIKTISVSKTLDHASQSHHGITKCKIRKMHAIVIVVVLIVLSGVAIGLKYFLAVPNVTILSAFYSVTRGQSVTIECSMSSFLGITSVFWQKMDDPTISLTPTTNPQKYRGGNITTPSLTIMNAKLDDAGHYTCFATNSAGTGASNGGTLVVKEAEPTVTISPTFYSVSGGQSVTIDCSVSSNLVVTSVFWQKKDGPTASTTLTTNSNKYRGSTVTTPSLTIDNADSDDSGNYTCFATNSVGIGASNHGNVLVTIAKPTVTISPTIYAVSISQSINLQCSVSSSVEVTSLSWQKNINGSTTVITSTTNPNKYRGVTVSNPSLTITNADEGDAGNYTCFATNSGGTGSSNTALLFVINVTTMDFKFNRSSVHKYWYINEDNTLISNVKTTDTVPSQGLGFQNYKGVMGDKCCAKDQEMTFGILYNYDIKKKLINGDLIMEVGLAERNKIDNYYYVGASKFGGWSFYLVNNENNDDVSFKVRHLPLTNEEILNHFSTNTPGTNTIGVFHFNINRKTNNFSVVSNQTKLYTFTNVMSDKDLCPVFLVYYSYYVNVSLRLLYSTIST